MFTGFRTSMHFGVLGNEDVRAILATTYKAVIEWPEPLRENLIYFPALDLDYGVVDSILFRGRHSQGFEMPGYHKNFAPDHEIRYQRVNALLGYDQERIGEMRIFPLNGEMLVLKRHLSAIRACWEVEYIGTDEGSDAERLILPLIVKRAAGHNPYAAVRSYAGRDASLLQEAGLSLPKTQQSSRHMERFFFWSGRG